MSLYNPLHTLCEKLLQEFDQISTERQKVLQRLATYISQKIKEESTPKLIVICTHNSRRSHLGQLWLAIGSAYFQLPNIETYSGGTEATAFNPRAVAACQRVGLQISKKNKAADNPIYEIKWKEEMTPYEAFSKKYEDSPNPTQQFGAIMVCTSADEGCPFVAGADFRLSLPFDDPKAYDDTDLETAKYDERLRQIGREILFALSQVK